MKSICKTLAIVELVAGIVSSFFVAGLYGVTTSLAEGTKRNWPITIVLFIMCVFMSLIVATVFYAIYDILDNQDIIYSKLEEIRPKKVSEFNDVVGWTCPKCGHVNPDTTGTCSCGNSKYA